ncbi:MAG TPA: hypothetical protein VGI50_07215 [Solirubrobacteraceae bacterium]
MDLGRLLRCELLSDGRARFWHDVIDHDDNHDSVDYDDDPGHHHHPGHYDDAVDYYDDAVDYYDDDDSVDYDDFAAAAAAAASAERVGAVCVDSCGGCWDEFVLGDAYGCSGRDWCDGGADHR